MSTYGRKPSQPQYEYEPVSTPLTPQEDGYRNVATPRRRRTKSGTSGYQATTVATPAISPPRPRPGMRPVPVVETEWAWVDDAEEDAPEESFVSAPEPFGEYGSEYEYEEDAFAFTAEFDYPSANRRMALVLIGVMLMVLFGVGVLWWSGLGAHITAVSNSQTAPAETDTTAENADPNYAAVLSDQATADIIANGQLSPIFAPEVLFWAPKIVEWANQWNLDPNLVATVMQIESCGDPQAISSAGARGLFQVMPFHFEEGEDMFAPDTNAYRGMKYLSLGMEMHGGDPNLAMAGYNGGHGTVPKGWNNWPNEMQRYYRWGSGIYGEITAGQATSPTLEQWLAAGGAGLCRQAADRQVALGLR